MKKKYKKLMLFLSLCFSMLIGLIIPSHAYYQDNNGNLNSSNLLPNSNGITLVENSSIFSVDFQLNETYTFSIYDGTGSGQYALFLYNNGLQVDVLTGGTSWDSSFTFTVSSVSNQFRIYANNIVSVNLMLNVGSVPLAYEPFGVIYYSESNYNNYGASQYSQGYTDGFNSIYNSLIDVNLSQHITGIGCGIYDSTGTTFVQNGTITSAYFESDYYYFNVSPVIANNYYVIPISFDNSYIFSSFRWSPNRFISPSLTINGVTYDSSSVTYNGTSYGWDNLNVNFDNSSNSVEFKFKINSNFDGLNLFINGKNLEIASALESYQSGYDNGQSVGYQSGYNDGFRNGFQSVTTDNSNFQKLIWTIGATPFESFKTIWDVDVMGLNISGIILGSLMALLVLYLIKKIWK